MEMKDVKKKYLEDMDIEAGQSSMSDGEGGGDEGDEGRGRGGKNDTKDGVDGDGTQSQGDKDPTKPPPPPLRLGEGKLTGPMRFVTCYASTFTFVLMTLITVGLLLISPPFNVEPAVRGDSNSSMKETTTVSPMVILTSVFPPDTGTPDFSSDFNQAEDS